jgi:transposase
MKGFLGIDISKGYADFVLLSDEGKKLEETLQLDDTRSGHEKLHSWLLDVVSKHNLSELNCAMESTGGFEDNWYAGLSKWNESIPLKVARLNPVVVKNSARAELQINTTDSESARNIASYIRRFSDQVDYQIRDTYYSSYRTLHNHIHLVTKQKTQIINELKQLLYITFPELQRYCKQSIPNWVLSLLIQYPSAIKLSKAKPEKLAKIKSITIEKACKLIENAKQSVAARNSATDEFVITVLAKDLASKEESITALKKYLAENCKGKETQLLESMKGIGSYSAASIMIQIEDIKRFASPKELVSYFGINPVIRESGDKRTVSRMSKKGKAAMRATLYMCANTAVLHDPHMKSIYARHRARGKAHRPALGAVMHKMLRVIWGVLTSGSPYNAEIDETNQSKNTRCPQDNTDAQITTKRRVQGFDQDAPISRLASKKRKAHVTSQVSNAEQVRDLEHEPSDVKI